MKNDELVQGVLYTVDSSLSPPELARVVRSGMPLLRSYRVEKMV